MYSNKEYIEDRLYGIVINDFELDYDKALKTWGIYIYTPLYTDKFGIYDENLYFKSNIQRHKHINGRLEWSKDY